MKRIATLLILLAFAAAPSLADMTGGTIQLLSPLDSDPGQTEVFHFWVENGSPDGEATNEVIFQFPGDFDVLGGWYDDFGQGWDFTFSIGGVWDEYAYFTDSDGGVGEILPGQSGEFWVEVYIRPNVDCGEKELRGKQYGDGTGANPHFMLQYMTLMICSIPVEESNWSTVKSLY